MGRHHIPADGDPFTTVIGKNDSWYPCPDTASVDRHIVELARRIGHAKRKYPELAKAYRADIDLLLDRRSWLALAEREAAEQSAAEQSAAEQSAAEQSTPEQSTPEQSTPEQSTPEQSTPEQSSDQPIPEQATAEQPVTEAA